MKFSDFINHVNQQIISFFKKGEGSYNDVYLTTSKVAIEEHQPQQWVLKQPKQIFKGELPMNMTARIHRKFAQIYPDIPVFDIEENQGLVLPLFREAPNDDKLLAETVLSIYQNTRVIIADGGLPSNFGLYEDKLICIDMDLALRRGSILSDQYYNQVISTSRYDRFFEEINDACNTPGTLELIKTLFYIENQLQGVEFNTHLISSWMIERLHVYRFKNQTFDLSSLMLLNSLEESFPEINPEWLIPSEIEIIKTQNLSLSDIPVILEERYQSSVAVETLTAQARLGFFESLPKIINEVEPPKTSTSKNLLAV